MNRTIPINSRIRNLPMPMPRESIPLNDLIERGTISPALAKSIAQSLQANRKGLITGCPAPERPPF